MTFLEGFSALAALSLSASTVSLRQRFQIDQLSSSRRFSVCVSSCCRELLFNCAPTLPL